MVATAQAEGAERRRGEQRRRLHEDGDVTHVLCSYAKSVDAGLLVIGYDGILDRLVHNAYRIELNGESMRKEKWPEIGRRSCLNRFLQY